MSGTPFPRGAGSVPGGFCAPSDGAPRTQSLGMNEPKGTTGSLEGSVGRTKADQWRAYNQRSAGNVTKAKLVKHADGKRLYITGTTDGSNSKWLRCKDVRDVNNNVEWTSSQSSASLFWLVPVTSDNGGSQCTLSGDAHYSHWHSNLSSFADKDVNGLEPADVISKIGFT